MENKHTNTELRLYISVRNGGVKKASNRIEITESVVNLGPLEISGDNDNAEPTAESIRLRLIPEPQFNPRNSQCVFQPGDTLTLEIFTGDEKRFYGVSSRQPELTESSNQLYLTLDFVGGLRELWQADEIEIAESDMEYIDIEQDLWEILKSNARLPITTSTLDINELTADESIWSTVARPNIKLPDYEPSEIDLWDIVSPVCDKSRDIVYAGFGPFVMSYAPATGNWNTVAYVVCNGAGWFIEHIEYDEGINRILGIASNPGYRISHHSMDAKAKFDIEL